MRCVADSVGPAVRRRIAASPTYAGIFVVVPPRVVTMSGFPQFVRGSPRTVTGFSFVNGDM